ncbi:MAG: endo-1,4-beta-xylanase [Terrimicrobiaceae bacterium]
MNKQSSSLLAALVVALVALALPSISTAADTIALTEGITPITAWPEVTDISTGDPAVNTYGMALNPSSMLSQTFTPAVPMTLKSLYFSYYTTAASATNSFTLKIQQVAGGGGAQTYSQGTNLLGSAPVTFSLANTGGAGRLLKFDFEGAYQIALAAGVTYAVEISSSISTVVLLRSVGFDSYSGGNLYLNRSAFNYPGTRDLAMSVVAAPAGKIVYSDDFSGSSGTLLSGTAPDVRSGTDGGSASATWAANSSWFANGSGSAGGTSMKASLPLTPLPGNVYTLSLDLNPTSGSNAFMVGFTDTTATTFGTGNSPCLTLKPDGTLQTLANGAVKTTLTSQPLNKTAEVVLDTTASAWSVQWFYNGNQVGNTFTYAANPATLAVKFAANNAAGTVDNFGLSVLSEPVSPFGISASHSSRLNLSQWISQAAATGVSCLRGFYNFSEIEPVQGTWDWTGADSHMSLCASNNLTIMGFLGFNAPWIDPNVQTFPTANLSAWQTYVTATVNHCKNQVRLWEVWNEPPNFSSSGTPTQYASTVTAAYDAAKAADPACQVGIAAQSANINWLDQSIAAGAVGHFDFVTLHPYEVLALVNGGWEAQYMSIVPTVRKMLAARDPAKANVPVWFTEIGAAIGGVVPGVGGANVTVTEDIQAQLLVKAYSMGIAQGVTCINWFEGRDGDSGLMGLLTGANVQRKAHTAMSKMVQYLGESPVYNGWVLLNTAANPDRDYGFVFQGATTTVMAAWAPPGITDPITFASPVTVVNPLTGTTTSNVTTYSLTSAPILVLGVPAGLVTQAQTNKTQPFPWGGDFSAATSVSISSMGDPNTENGLHQISANALSTYSATPYGAARYCALSANQYFTVDPNFLSYTTTPITITAVFRRNAANDNAGFNLKYESTTGEKSAGWYTVPGNAQWYTKSWTITDAQFTGKWGYHFRFDSDSTTYGKYYIQSVTVSKP